MASRIVCVSNEAGASGNHARDVDRRRKPRFAVNAGCRVNEDRVGSATCPKAG